MNDGNKISTIDEYIAGYPVDIQTILVNLRDLIRSLAPEAAEKIGYGIPTFTLFGKNLVHFAAFKNHIGFYPDPSGIKKFEQELASYNTSKGAIQFPINQPIPYELVSRIVQYRVEEISKAVSEKKKKGKNTGG
jgi:uncharacterized protein YdhG (YjbR/CyaY superfamily)